MPLHQLQAVAVGICGDPRRETPHNCWTEKVLYYRRYSITEHQGTVPKTQEISNEQTTVVFKLLGMHILMYWAVDDHLLHISPYRTCTLPALVILWRHLFCPPLGRYPARCLLSPMCAELPRCRRSSINNVESSEFEQKLLETNRNSFNELPRRYVRPVLQPNDRF